MAEEDDEFANLVSSMSDEELIAWAQNLRKAVEENMETLGVSQSELAFFSEKIETYAKDVEKTKRALEELEIAKAEEQKALDRLAKAVFEAMEQQEKPIIIPVGKAPKRYNSH